MGRVRKQEGPGRPKFVVRKDEVRLGARDVEALEWWGEQCEEVEKGRALRRALAVVVALPGVPVTQLMGALKATQGILEPNTVAFVRERYDVRLAQIDANRFIWWQGLSGEREKGRAWRRLLHVLRALPEKALRNALKATEEVRS